MTNSAEDRPTIHLNWYLIAALLIACVTAWPLISGGGLINTRGGGDSPFLLQRLHQLEQAIYDGHFPVRWMGDANYGYGYPFFNFYAPFAFYIAFIYRLAGASFVQAIQLSQLTAFLVAAWGAFSLAQRWYRRDWVALVVSAAYTTAPFHLVNVYVRGDSIAEFWAMAFYPLVILAADRLILSDSLRGRMGVSWLNGIAWLGLAYAGLILSHNISAMIFSPFLILFCLCRLAPVFLKTNGSTSVRLFSILPKLTMLVTALLLGMALSAWFWLPALSEQYLTSIADMTVGYFNYRYNNGVHFRSADLVQASLLFDPSLLGGQAFRMGLIQALVTIIALIGLVMWRSVRKRLGWGVWLFMVLGLFVSSFMLNPLSIFLWDTLPLLSFTQFPWRFLSVQAFFTAMLSGVPIFALMRFFGRNPNHSSLDVRKRPIWLAPTLSGLIAVGLVIIALGKLDLTYLPVLDKDVTGYRLAQYEWFTRNIGTTVSAEYLPPEAHPRPVTSPWLDHGDRNKVIVVSGMAEAELISRKTGRQEWRVTVSEDDRAIVVFPTLFWEGWNALLDGEIWGGTPARLSGLMQVTVPPGTHDVTLVLGKTRVRAIGELISVSFLVLTLVVFATDTRRWQLGRALLRGVVLPILAFFIVMLAWSFEPAISEAEAIYSQDFAQLGWLHPEAEIMFENGAVLQSFAVAQKEVQVGGAFDIELVWGNVPAGVDAELALVLPADNFTTRVFPASQIILPLKNGINRYQLQLPGFTPAGLVTPRLTLSDGSFSLATNGELRGEIFLEPLLIQAESEEVVSTQDDLADIDLTLQAVTHPRPEMLQLDMGWFTRQPLAENLVASFRLTDANGNEIHGAQQDFQPGFGHHPSSAWTAGSLTFDTMGMKLPQPLPYQPPYTLLVYLYEPDNRGKIRLFRRLGTLEGGPDQLIFRPNPIDFTVPDNATLVDVPLMSADGPVLTLHSYHAEQKDGGLEVTLYWQANVRPPADYTHFVHLIDPKTGKPVAQHDSMPSNYTWATSQLAPGQIIEDRLFLPTANLASGEYLLTTGLYQNDGARFPRLMQANGGNGVIELEKIQIGGN